MKKITYIVFKLIVTLITLIILLIGSGFIYYKTRDFSMKLKNNANLNEIGNKTIEVLLDNDIEIDDWRLVLVNKENLLPSDFSVELTKVGVSKEFDARAANELLVMLQEMKNSGASNIWIQSAYRTPEYQENLYQNKVQDFILMGKSKQDAELLASKWVNKPETSEHNLGLAIDFNDVNKDFENTKEFKWLIENAEDYGFVLRYKKEKKEITKVNYEPWHWRYVGVENAREMNRLDMCLEEYLEYLKDNNTANF